MIEDTSSSNQPRAERTLGSPAGSTKADVVMNECQIRVMESPLDQQPFNRAAALR